jgi:molybdopterin synthase sulfur carrier subunit
LEAEGRIRVKVRIQVFAALKKFFETEFEIEIPDHSTGAVLHKHLLEKNPQSLDLLNVSNFAVGDSIISLETEINPAEKVFVLPPSSGG